MNYIKELNAFQKRENLSTAEMARHFGVEWQIYKNWVNRQSLPKKHYGAANKLLGVDILDDEQMRIVKMFGDMSPEARAAAIRSVEAIHDLESKS